MAMYWLDLVRYADTIGYHSDNPMNVSPYRDYVIKAFNDNKPFDQFTIEQLAGDLLPNATHRAEGRHRPTTGCCRRPKKAARRPKEYEAKYAADRVRNVSTVWMAATMGCCQCHDHKFDPFTHEGLLQHGGVLRGRAGSAGRPARAGNAGAGRRAGRQSSKQLDDAIAAAEEEAGRGRRRSWPRRRRSGKSSTRERRSSGRCWSRTSADVAGESKLRKRAGRRLCATTARSPPRKPTPSPPTPICQGITGFRLEALPDDALARATARAPRPTATSS